MSEVAGKMSIQEGAKYLEKPMMGRGILLGGVPGVAPAHVVILGAGIVGTTTAQGGAAETPPPTTPQNPPSVVEGVVHYCVTNMPGAVGRTSTIALCNATLPYALKIANQGYEKAAQQDPG